jgi:hypothetical protein
MCVSVVVVGDYTIENVWDEMQKEVMALIGYYIEAEFQDFKRLDVSNSHKLFAFSASAAFSAPEDHDAKKWDYSEINMGTPSPYKLAPIYPIIVGFSDAALALLSPLYAGSILSRRSYCGIHTYLAFFVPGRSLPSTLKSWIDDFVHLTFLQHIKQDYRLRASVASTGKSASSPVGVPNDNNRRSCL